MPDGCPRCGGTAELKRDEDGSERIICRDCSLTFEFCICRPLEATT